MAETEAEVAYEAKNLAAAPRVAKAPEVEPDSFHPAIKKAARLQDADHLAESIALMHVIEGDPADDVRKMMISERERIGRRMAEDDVLLLHDGQSIAEGQGVEIEIDADPLSRRTRSEAPEGLAPPATEIEDHRVRPEGGPVEETVELRVRRLPLGFEELIGQRPPQIRQVRTRIGESLVLEDVQAVGRDRHSLPQSHEPGAGLFDEVTRPTRDLLERRALFPQEFDDLIAQDRRGFPAGAATASDPFPGKVSPAIGTAEAAQGFRETMVVQDRW
jgi:hypothetical protein